MFNITFPIKIYISFINRFSEMYIFGKFDTFKRRLEKIIQLLDVFEMFSPLSDAKIEGIEPHAARFSQIVAGLKKKPYNLLDQKNLTFDADFGEFMQVVSELQVTIIQHCFHPV